jgi:uncharacterized membrane protein
MELIHRASVRSRFGRFVVARRRLLVAIVAGIALAMVLPPTARLSTRFLLGWNLTAFIYVAFVFLLIARSTVETCRARAALYDENDWVIVGLVVGSAAASFVAIFAELAAIRSGLAPVGISLAMTGLTVALAWTFTHLMFTLHYANLYYRPHKGGVPGGLHFPGDEPPDYRDFLYYSFVIGCATQTADVATTSRDMRLVSLVHGIIAFAFNTAILALMINVGASLLS